jgi:hypothetical protein
MLFCDTLNIDMPIIQEMELPQGKTIGDLGIEALWFALHTFLAVLILGLVLGAMALAHANPDAIGPKIVGLFLAFFAPLVGGFIIARMHGHYTARYVWVAGLLFFAAACVWVLDLPTGPGLCESCGAVDKLVRTFFVIDNGSGLLGGDGFLVGTLIPLSMFGYAAGARLGLNG